MRSNHYPSGPFFSIYRLLSKRSEGHQEESATVDRSGRREDVVNLYKNLLYLSREWPTDLRPKIKNAFIKNRDVKDPEEISKLIKHGEYVCREITATYHLRKYRAMKRRYYSEEKEKELEKIFEKYNK